MHPSVITQITIFKQKKFVVKSYSHVAAEFTSQFKKKREFKKNSWRSERHEKKLSYIFHTQHNQNQKELKFLNEEAEAALRLMIKIKYLDQIFNTNENSNSDEMFKNYLRIFNLYFTD